MPDISVSNLTKSFPTATEPLLVLDGVSLELDQGQNLAVVGPSGSGKSTLLHILGTLDEPTSGQVTLFGQHPFELNEKQLAHFRNENIGFIFQEHHLLPQLSALENVLIPAVAEGAASAAEIDRGRQLLEQVGLAQRAAHRPSELSGGERQRVAIARAMLQSPRLVLADEPTGSLDRKNSDQVTRMLLDLQKSEQVIMVGVTHNEEVAARFDRCVVLNEAKLEEKQNVQS